MNRLWATFLTTSPLFKLGFAVAVVAVLALVSGSVGGFVSHMKDKAFDKQITALKAERTELQAKADAAEEKAKSLEADKIKFQLALEVAEKQGAKAQEKIADAQKKYDEQIAVIDADADVCERLALLRAKLGLKPAECKAE